MRGFSFMGSDRIWGKPALRHNNYPSPFMGEGAAPAAGGGVRHSRHSVSNALITVCGARSSHAQATRLRVPTAVINAHPHPSRSTPTPSPMDGEGNWFFGRGLRAGELVLRPGPACWGTGSSVEAACWGPGPAVEAPVLGTWVRRTGPR